jgi:sterol 14alpha-demethylase
MKPTPPMMSGLPVLGNVLEFMNKRRNLLLRGHEQHGEIFAINLAMQPVAVVSGETGARAFFDHTDKELRMDKAYEMLKAMFGAIAFTASPELYNAQRHILHAPFKGPKMAGYAAIMQREIQMLLDALDEHGEMDISKTLTPLAQNIAAHTILGEDFRNSMGREFWDLYMDLSKAMDMVLPPNLPLPKFFRRDRAKVKMRAMVKPYIDVRRANPEQYDDMLSELANARYEDGTLVDDDTIVGLVIAFMFAGHETTVGQAAWTLVELLRNPTYASYIQAEIDAQLPYGTPLTRQKLGQLEHVEWAVNETTRTHPSADMIMRHVEADIEVGGYRIPAGWKIVLSSDITHNLEQTWTCPHQFDPHRFAPDRKEDAQHKHTITGFGGGTHKCTGMNFANMEMTMIVALFFQQLDMQLLTTDPQTTYSLGAARPDNVRVRFQRKRLHATPVTAAEPAMMGCPVHHG